MRNKFHAANDIYNNIAAVFNYNYRKLRQSWNRIKFFFFSGDYNILIFFKDLKVSLCFFTIF